MALLSKPYATDFRRAYYYEPAKVLEYRYDVDYYYREIANTKFGVMEVPRIIRELQSFIDNCVKIGFLLREVRQRKIGRVQSKYPVVLVHKASVPRGSPERPTGVALLLSINEKKEFGEPEVHIISPSDTRGLTTSAEIHTELMLEANALARIVPGRDLGIADYGYTSFFEYDVLKQPLPHMKKEDAPLYINDPYLKPYATWLMEREPQPPIMRI